MQIRIVAVNYVSCVSYITLDFWMLVLRLLERAFPYASLQSICKATMKLGIDAEIYADSFFVNCQLYVSIKWQSHGAILLVLHCLRCQLCQPLEYLNSLEA